jgi:hypothetical protein
LQITINENKNLSCYSLKRKEKPYSWMWWGTLGIPALRKLRWEENKFKASLGYTMRQSQNNNNNNNYKRKPLLRLNLIF